MEFKQFRPQCNRKVTKILEKKVWTDVNFKDIDIREGSHIYIIKR